MNDFLQHLRERKLVQWALAYIAAAFALIQVFDIIAQRFGWPESIERGLIVVLAIGFFVTLVLAWYHGERGAQRASGTELLILALLLAIGGAILWRFAPGVASSSALQTMVSAAPAAVFVNSKSIAVLPFDNLSADKDNEYFASGMQDMILTKLAAIGDLKVISRTSTVKYSSHPENLKVVAQQLGVATILEGSVQKAGNSVLINVQLIDAGNDAHLWAEAYPRTLENIFGVEGEVAQKVADALKAKLTPTESAAVASVPTHNPEAYDLYLRANANLRRGAEAAALVPKLIPVAIELYRQALAKDPGFALAAAEQAQAHMNMYWFAPDHTAERLAAAKAAAEQALKLQADLGAAHFALGLYWYWGHRDYAQALQQLELARIDAPNNAQLLQYFAAINRRQGHWDEAIATYQHATTLNPRSSLLFDQLAYSYACVRRYAEADRAFAQSTSVAGDPIDEQLIRAWNGVLWKGDLAPLRSALGAVKPGTDDYAGNITYFYWLAQWSRDYPAAIAAAENDSAENWADNGNVTLPRLLYLAMAYDANGNVGKAHSIYAAVRTQMQAALVQRGDDPDLHLAWGFAAAGLGLRDEAIREGRKSTELMPVSRDSFSGPVYLTWLAQLYARVGDNDQALDILQHVLVLPFSGIAVTPELLKLSPAWDPLRKDPRFAALLKKTETSP